MAKLLTRGDDFKIGAYHFPDRKRPSICVEEGSRIRVCGSFHDDETAEWFMSKLAELLGLEEDA